MQVSNFLAQHDIPYATNPEPYLIEEAYGTSAPALAVVLPVTTEQVVAIVRFAAQNSIALVPQGGNSNRTRAAIAEPDRDSIIINMRNMAAIEQISASHDTMTLQAGCTLAEAQAAAIAQDQIIGIDLGARDWCQIGGNIATNAGGMQCVRYGNMREQVLGIEVVTPDGKILNMLNSLAKNNAGYDMKQLFIGSEGTLGIITRAVLRLHPKPQDIQTTAIACSTLDNASTFFRNAQKQWGAGLQRCEYLSPAAQQTITDMGDNLPLPFTPYPEALLLLEISDLPNPDPLHNWLAQQMENGIIANALPAQNQGQSNIWWRIRERCGGINPAHGRQVKHDIAVPPEQLPTFIHAAKALLAEKFPAAQPIPFGHWGDGNLHYNLSPVDPAQQIAPFTVEINQLVENLAVTHGGTFSAEHGIGQCKKSALLRLKDPATLALMQTVKNTIDPQNIMNPNKIFT